MVRPELVRRKLAQLHGYLAELEVHRNISFQDYTSTSDKKRAIERLLELLVEVVVDWRRSGSLMVRAFDLLQQFPDVFQGKPRF